MSYIFVKYMSFLWKRENISLLNQRFHSVGSELFCRLETDQGPRTACSPYLQSLHAQIPVFLNSKHGHTFSFGKKLIS